MSLSCHNPSRDFLKPFYLLLGICGFSIACSGTAAAAEWSTRANIQQFFGYDDNVFMRPTDTQGSFQYKIIPTLSFLHRTDVSEINAHASYGTQIFPDAPQFDQDIQNYGLNGMYKTDRIDWGLNFNYSIIPTRNTAIQDAGDFSTAAERATWAVSPSMAYKLSEIDSLILSPSYSESSFDNTSTSGNATLNSFRNNITKSVNLGWQRIWTERYNTNLSFFYSNFEFEQSGSGIIFIPNTNIPITLNSGSGFFSSNDSYGFNFANNYRWSDNWNLTGSIGFRHSESSSIQGSSSSSGFLANIGAHYNAENYDAGVTFSRSLVPSNFGQLQELTGTTLHFNYKFDERLTAGLDMSYQDSNVVNAANSFQRENIVVHPSINWLLAKDWSLNASYRYRVQDLNFNNQPINADSNLFLFSVNYRWPGLKVSK